MEWLMNLIGYPLGWVMWLAYKIVPVYSIALIIFTIIMRAVMLPLSIKQQRNSAHMALFRPKVDAINKKYANNRQKAQEEINKLYEREGYNPFGGCSSLLIQLPVIYGLIDVVYRPMTHLLRLESSVIESAKLLLEKAGVDFATARTDIQLRILGKIDEYKDVLINGTGGIEGIGAEAYDKMASLDLNLFGIINLGDTPTWAFNALLLIPVFSLLTALASSFISMKMTQDNNEAQGKGCMYGMLFGMPFMSAYFSFIVPAGVGLYWIISNIVAAVQSVVLRKIITPEKVAAKLERDKQKGKKVKKSKFMTKLMEAQEQAAVQQGGYSQKEKELSDEQKKALAEAQRTKALSDKEKLAEARRRYAEKYGDDIKD